MVRCYFVAGFYLVVWGCLLDLFVRPGCWVGVVFGCISCVHLFWLNASLWVVVVMTITVVGIVVSASGCCVCGWVVGLVGGCCRFDCWILFRWVVLMRLLWFFILLCSCSLLFLLCCGLVICCWLGCMSLVLGALLHDVVYWFGVGGLFG